MDFKKLAVTTTMTGALGLGALGLGDGARQLCLARLGTCRPFRVHVRCMSECAE